jgi:hypothetical protein
MIECEFCKNCFSNKSNLKIHQKTVKYCLKIQGKDEKKDEKKVFKCLKCKRELSTYQRLQTHYTICVPYQLNLLSEKLNEEFEKEKTRKDTIILNLKKIIQEQKEDKNNFIDELKNQICELRKSLTECAMEAIKNQKDENKVKKLRIKYLENKYLKKQKRVEYKGNNFIYILTTPGLKKERRYILGKATNLTNRLSTYNKTDEHEVVFYSHCPCKDTMGVIEGLVFTKLNKYRERANRERFILPHDQDIDIFVNCIKRCVDFVK